VPVVRAAAARVGREVDEAVAVVVDAVLAGGRLRDEARGAQLGLVLARRLRGRSDLEPAVELAEGPARPAPAADVEAVRARGPGRALDAVEVHADDRSVGLGRVAGDRRRAGEARAVEGRRLRARSADGDAGQILEECLLLAAVAALTRPELERDRVVVCRRPGWDVDAEADGGARALHHGFVHAVEARAVGCAAGAALDAQAGDGDVG